ncbi:MAG: alpha/beta hydrolase [Pseudomonadales bacterium]
MLIRCVVLIAMSISFHSELAAEQPVPAKYSVPRHVSAEAQAILSRPVLMEGRLVRPSSSEQWQQLKRQQSLRVQPQIELLKSAPINIKRTEMGGVTVRILTPEQIPAAKQDKVLIGLHGGAYVFFGGEASVLEAANIALAGQYKVIAVDYRMPPEHPFPHAVNDAVAVYKAVLETTAAENIAVFGTSAGGSLTASMIVSARDQGLPLPAAAYMNTPWSDLSKTGDSYVTNEAVDPVLPVYGGALAAAAEVYADVAGLKHPLVSPVYADYSQGFPPSLLITGTRDLLLSSTVRLHRVLREAGVNADLHVFDAMWHAFTANIDMPEAQRAQRLVIDFLDTQLLASSATRPASIAKLPKK